MTFEGVEEGYEKEALQELMQKFVKNCKAISPEDRQGKYKKAFDSLWTKIGDLATWVYLREVEVVSFDGLTDVQVNILKDIEKKGALEVNKALARVSFSAFEETISLVRKKFCDAYLKILDGTYCEEKAS